MIPDWLTELVKQNKAEMHIINGYSLEAPAKGNKVAEVKVGKNEYAYIVALSTSNDPVYVDFQANNKSLGQTYGLPIDARSLPADKLVPVHIKAPESQDIAVVISGIGGDQTLTKLLCIIAVIKS